MAEQHNKPMSARYSLDRFLARGAFVACVRFGGLACVFALQIMLARLVGDTAEYGKYAWGQALFFMAGNLACIGIPTVTARFIASLSARREEHAIRGVLNAAIGLLLLSCALPIAIAIGMLFLWQDDTALYRDVAIIALLLCPAITFTSLYRDTARARQWLGLALLPLQLFRPLLTGLFVLACVYLLQDFWQPPLRGPHILFLAGLSVLCILIPQALIVHRRLRPLRGATPSSQASQYHPSLLLRTAFPVFLIRCAALIMTYSNILLLGFFAGPAAAGAYFAAERLAQLIGIPRTIVSQVNQQSMAAAFATDEPQYLQRLATQSAHGALWPTLATGLLLALFAVPLLSLFGKDFTTAQSVLLILTASMVVNAFTGPAQDILLMTGRQQRIPFVMGTSAVIHVVALAILVPPLGAIGAALATLASGALSQLWLMRLCYQETSIGTTIFHRAKTTAV